MSDGARPSSSDGPGIWRILVAALPFVVAACAGGAAPAGSPTVDPASGPPAPTVTAATSPGPTSEASGAAIPGAFGSVPTACFGLGEDDCRRVAGHVAALATGADPRVRYVQVGPFGCAAGEGCPTTLVARPEGDVTIETATGALGYHVTAAGDTVQVRVQETFGVSLLPSSTPPLPLIPQPFSLGHCGLWSGVDLGGSWWDPVGLIDSDHGDAINAADGRFAPIGADRATFTSKGGLVVQLVRRDGDKFLPFCR